MRLVSRAALAASALSLVASCNAKPVGEMVLVVQTDLSLPKDIDFIRIEVTSNGIPKYKGDFDQVGTPKGQIKLPGTLSLVASDNPSDAVDIVVSARSGGTNGKVRMLREVVTTIPVDRSVLMPLPVQFLCSDTSGMDDGTGNTINKCPMGQTCLAGECKDSTVDSSTLRTYEEKAALGDGSCFDPKHCYDNAKVAVLDDKCTFDAGSPNVNVALQTEGDGLCSVNGCYVTLDARDPLGWNLTTDGRIQLPTAVCEGKKDTIVNVVYAPITDACKQKNTALPTCGPWSNAANNPLPTREPVALAGGQAHPGSLTLGGGKILWTTAGGGGPASGAVKSVDPSGGKPKLIASNTAARSVTTAKLNNTTTLTLWTTATSGAPMSGGVFVNDGNNTTQLQMGLLNPEGIAAVGSLLFWTDFTSGAIYVGKTSPSMKAIAATGNYPFRIVADARYAYWTNEGTAAKMDGSIGRYDTQTGTVDVLAMNQATPRATALELDKDGLATAIYFATFIKGGAIYRVPLTGAAPGAPTAIASGLAYPNGIAVDDANVYFTARDEGKVLSLARNAAMGTPPTVLASGQASPAAVAVDAGAVYWVNEGSSLMANGAIIKLDKAP